MPGSSKVIRVFVDFNARDEDGLYPFVRIDGIDINNEAPPFDLHEGKIATLFQDEDDFEVSGMLERKTYRGDADDRWVAKPNWSTFKRLKPRDA